MSDHSKKYIALLRGINVGGHNKIPMAELRDLCDQIGFEDIASYIQSGNLVFTASLESTVVEDMLERAILKRFGFEIPVIVRAASEWGSIVEGNPFPTASGKEPNLVMLGLNKHVPLDGVRQKLLGYAKNNERVELVNGHLWTHFPEGSGRSKITPAVLDRITGSVVTCRNWRTVQKLTTMAGLTGSN